MNEEECTHENMVDDVPHDVGSWVGQGYICADCGFQTMRVSTYVPTPKPCPQCGKEFEGMPDVDTEPCDECFQKNLDVFAAQLKIGESS